MCLYRVGDKLDESKLKLLLKEFGMLDVWQVFGHVAVEQLGLPKEKFPLYSKRKKFVGRKITALAMEYGNFGQEHYKYMVSDSVEMNLYFNFCCGVIVNFLCLDLSLFNGFEDGINESDSCLGERNFLDYKGLII